jgi:succinoglycan biosynthesis protein ExoM
MLGRCLASLMAQGQPEGRRLHIVVVDNDREPTSREIVAGFASQGRFPVTFAHEPRQGIPFARNRIVDCALGLQAEWIAMIDDDETASPDWICKLLEMAERYDANVIQGRVIRTHAEPRPFWGVEKIEKRHEGDVLKSCPTSNVIFSADLIRPDGLGLRFNEAMRFTGGSDSFFFEQAHDEGARIVYSDAPVVYEEVPPSRATYAWHVKRGFRVGSNKALRMIHMRGKARSALRLTPRIGAQYARGALQLALAPLFIPFSMKKFKHSAKQGGRSIGSATGAILALLSIYAQPYRRTDGF